MLWKISKKFQVSAEKIIPDPLVFCLGLTLILFIVGLIIGAGPIAMIEGWYSGLWSQSLFAFQMSLLVLFTASAANAPQVERILTKISKIPKSRVSAILFIMIFGFLTSLFNWAFCMILVPIFARQICRQNKDIHFPLMIAAGYTTMPLGQCINPTESAYIMIATPGHFLESKIGVLSQNLTSFNPVSLATFACVAIVFILLTLAIKPPKDEIISYDGNDEDISKEIAAAHVSSGGKKDISDILNDNKLLLPLLGIAALVIIVKSIMSKGIMDSLNFNFVIFLFLTLNLFLYVTPNKFLNALNESIPSVTGIMFQFPLYGGMMGLMESSQITVLIADVMVKISTLRTFPVTAFISAAVVNIFIPSQGGQWMVQGPFLVEAAQELGANIPVMINAFVHGDECTNLINPLYMIPAIAVVNLKLKQVWGFMAFYSLTWIVVAIIALLIFPSLFGMLSAVM